MLMRTVKYLAGRRKGTPAAGETNTET